MWEIILGNCLQRSYSIEGWRPEEMLLGSDSLGRQVLQFSPKIDVFVYSISGEVEFEVRLPFSIDHARKIPSSDIISGTGDDKSITSTGFVLLLLRSDLSLFDSPGFGLLCAFYASTFTHKTDTTSGAKISRNHSNNVSLTSLVTVIFFLIIASFGFSNSRLVVPIPELTSTTSPTSVYSCTVRTACL